MIFKTIIGIMKGESENVRRVCEDIRKKDPNFCYEIFKPSVAELRDKFENLLVIYSATKKEGQKWGGWFIHKCKAAKLSNYFWTKAEQ